MRILSLAPSNTEILFALDLGDQIIGVTSYCDYPAKTKTKPKIGSWITTQPEKIKELSPDLIFTSYFFPPVFRSWKGPGKVVHVAPKTLQQVFESILVIGRSTNRIKKAESLVKKMKTEFAQITSSIYPSPFLGEGTSRAIGTGVRGKPAVHYLTRSADGGPPSPTRRGVSRKNTRHPTVYMEEWPVPPMASGNWVPELVEIAGGVPVIAKKGKPSAEFALDDLIQSDPDFMIFHWCGFGTRFDKNMIRKRPGWNQLRSVREDKMYVVDDSLLNRPGPRLVQGARNIQKILRSL